MFFVLLRPDRVKMMLHEINRDYEKYIVDRFIIGM